MKKAKSIVVEIDTIGVNTVSIHLLPKPLSSDINFAQDARRLAKALVEHCPVGTMVELFKILKEEMGK
jgi:hypothetical protein